MGMIDLLKSAGFISVFVISIVTFAVLFAENNDSDISLIDDVRFSDLNQTLRTETDNLADDGVSSSAILFKTTLDSGDEHASTGGQFKIGPTTASKITINSFKTSFGIIFGEGSEFTFIAVAFVTLLIFIGGYYAFKAWFGRDPN